MGQAAVRPAFVTVRRILAGTLALLANGALLAVILLGPRVPIQPRPLNVIDLQLVADRLPEVEPEPDDLPVQAPAAPVAAPPPEHDAAAEDEPSGANPAGHQAVAPDRPANPSADSFADYGIVALPQTATPGGTPYVIRQIFCLTTSQATREAGDCDDDPGPDALSMLGHASAANLEAGLQAATGHGMGPEQIRALYEGDGLPLADLSGEPTLADAGQRPTSSADQMRDSLPPRHPDPVFRD